MTKKKEITVRPYYSRVFGKHQHSLTPKAENQAAYLSADCMIFIHRCRAHVGELRYKVACQVRDYHSGPEAFNETFLLQRNVTDRNDEKCSVSQPYLLGLVKKC